MASTFRPLVLPQGTATLNTLQRLGNTSRYVCVQRRDAHYSSTTQKIDEKNAHYSTMTQKLDHDTALETTKIPSSLTAASSGLERMPTWALTRNLMLGTMFTSPFLFRIGLSLMERIANSQSGIFNPDSNPLLRAIVKPIVYDQFCAGTNRKEILRTRDQIKQAGYAGVILCYGKEIQVSKSNEIWATGKDSDQTIEIRQWRDGNLETLDMVGEGDWLGIKLTGAGRAITNTLMEDQPAPPEFLEAMDAIARKAEAKNCRIWIDAEQQVLQKAIDNWTIDMMRKYNRNGKAIIYNTIQAYLKASRPKLQHQLELSKQEGWTLAIKLVRGAYIANDYRDRIHDTKQDTDDSYNSIVHDLLSGQNLLPDPPKMQLFLAGHNPESISRAFSLTQDLSAQGKLHVKPDFGQLQGMADHLGCKVVQQCDELKRQGGDGVVVPRIYKCLTWGSVQECMQYLLRRVVENQGGADRMRDGLGAYWGELRRRMGLGRA